MWSFRALLIPLALAACGFEPVNTAGGAGAALRGQVLVQDPDTRDGFLLVQRLEERLGRGGKSAYALDHTIKTSTRGLAIDRDGDVRRFNVLGQVDWALRDLETGEIRASGLVENFTGYSATGTTVATLSAERDAKERLMTLLADQIVQRLQTTRLAP